MMQKAGIMLSVSGGIFPVFKERARAMKGESAQITIDYVAGISIFLLTVAFVFQFIYGLFTPFESYSDEIMLAAGRASTVLVERLLAPDNSGGMNIIDQGKLYYFNNTKLNQSDQTLYKNTLGELGLYGTEIMFDANMSVLRLNGGIMNQSGPALPENTDIGQIKRLVLIINTSTGYNETAYISVRIW